MLSVVEKKMISLEDDAVHHTTFKCVKVVQEVGFWSRIWLYNIFDHDFYFESMRVGMQMELRVSVDVMLLINQQKVEYKRLLNTNI